MGGAWGPMWRSSHTPDVVTDRTIDVQGKKRKVGGAEAFDRHEPTLRVWSRAKRTQLKKKFKPLTSAWPAGLGYRTTDRRAWEETLAPGF